MLKSEKLRPDQQEYFMHLLRSWGMRDWDWKWSNVEGQALRKTLDNRP